MSQKETDQSLIDAFEIKKICIADFTLVQIFMITGRRPVQLADLKVKDFIKVEAQNYLREYLLNVPRRKQQGLDWRKQFKPFALSVEVGALLENSIQKK